MFFCDDEEDGGNFTDEDEDDGYVVRVPGPIVHEAGGMQAREQVQGAQDKFDGIARMRQMVRPLLKDANKFDELCLYLFKLCDVGELSDEQRLAKIDKAMRKLFVTVDSALAEEILNVCWTHHEQTQQIKQQQQPVVSKRYAHVAVFEDPLAESESDEDESGDESDGLQKSTSKSRQVGLTILETDVQEAITVNIWSEMPMEDVLDLRVFRKLAQVNRDGNSKVIWRVARATGNLGIVVRVSKDSKNVMVYSAEHNKTEVLDSAKVEPVINERMLTQAQMIQLSDAFQQLEHKTQHRVPVIPE